MKANAVCPKSWARTESRVVRGSTGSTGSTENATVYASLATSFGVDVKVDKLSLSYSRRFIF